MIYNGAITITSPRDGAHRTFEIKTKKLDAKFAPGKRVLALLTGPDNTSNYTGFAFIDDKGACVWRSKRTPEFEAYAKMVYSLSVHGERSPFYVKGYRMMQERSCIRCNRRLTHPASIESGIGPECAGR